MIEVPQIPMHPLLDVDVVHVATGAFDVVDEVLQIFLARISPRRPVVISVDGRCLRLFDRCPFGLREFCHCCPLCSSTMEEYLIILLLQELSSIFSVEVRKGPRTWVRCGP